MILKIIAVIASLITIGTGLQLTKASLLVKDDIENSSQRVAFFTISSAISLAVAGTGIAYFCTLI